MNYSWIFSALRADIHARPFIPEEFELTVFMSVNFAAPPIRYSVCCDDYQNGCVPTFASLYEYLYFLSVYFKDLFSTN